jgi:hypothetical protein
MLSLAKFIRKEIELRNNLIGSWFLDPPAKYETQDEYKRSIQAADYRVTALGEIVSASGFNSDKLYIFYDTMMSEGWTFEDFNDTELYGMTRDDSSEINKR